MFENYTRFEWGVEVGVVTIFMLRLFVPLEFDMVHEMLFIIELKPTLNVQSDSVGSYRYSLRV